LKKVYGKENMEMKKPRIFIIYKRYGVEQGANLYSEADGKGPGLFALAKPFSQMLRQAGIEDFLLGHFDIVIHT
jgi:hypothetical protein